MYMYMYNSLKWTMWHCHIFRFLSQLGKLMYMHIYAHKHNIYAHVVAYCVLFVHVHVYIVTKNTS